LEGEHSVIHLRRHVYTLIGPALVLLLCSGVGAFLVATVPESGARTALRWIIAGAVAAVAARWAVWPFAVWYANTHVLTTRRLIRREGVFGSRGVELGLGRVLDVSCRRTVLQRTFGAGRLTISFADPAAPGGRGSMVVDDVPLIVDVQRLLLAHVEAAPRAVWPPPAPPDPALPGLY